MFTKKKHGEDAGAVEHDFSDGEGVEQGDEEEKEAGDGLHHHELHEDEAGGYHSKHTHPDGRVEHGEHADYEEACDHMDEAFGQKGEDRDQTEGEADGGDMSEDDIAGSYGRAASRD